MPFARHSPPTGIPRPHQWLLMGVQACRLPAPKPVKPSERSKPLKPLKPINGFLWASSAGKSYPQGQIPRSSVPFARHSQPTGIPRPHQWLLVGVQACRLPAPKPLKPSERSKPLKRLKPVAFSGRSSVPFARHSQPTGIPGPHQWLIMASYGRPSLPFASP